MNRKDRTTPCRGLRLTTLAVLLLLGSPLLGQEDTAAANRLTFDLDGNGAGKLSADAKTLSVPLPEPTAIGSSYAGRTARMRLAYETGRPRPQARFVRAQASHRRVKCYIHSGYRSAPDTFSCTADPTWLRHLKSRTTVRIEVQGSAVKGKLQASWILTPSPTSDSRRP
ncbi:MAG: hypothetical protein AAGA81_19855 [Acidobacteriota bacterium]